MKISTSKVLNNIYSYIHSNNEYHPYNKYI